MTDAYVGLAICGFLLGLYKIANGRLAKKVSQDTCRANISGMHKLFKEHSSHIDQRFDDLKEFIKNGGNKSST